MQQSHDLFAIAKLLVMTLWLKLCIAKQKNTVAKGVHVTTNECKLYRWKSTYLRQFWNPRTFRKQLQRDFHHTDIRRLSLHICCQVETIAAVDSCSYLKKVPTGTCSTACSHLKSPTEIVKLKHFLLGKGGPENTGPFLKVCTSCIRRRRKVIHISNSSVLYLK